MSKLFRSFLSFLLIISVSSNNFLTFLTEEEVLKYAAKDGEIYQGVTETVNAGFESPEYVNLHNELGSSLTLKVEVPNEGNYLITFRMANGSANDRKMKIELNGDTENYWLQSFPSTGEWTNWETQKIVLPMKKGENTIKCISFTTEGGPNLDYITLQLTNDSPAEIYTQPSFPATPQGQKTGIYIAGDSTVQTYNKGYAPQQGWGYYLGEHFNSNVQVFNHALGGRSARSFVEEKRLDEILKNIKEGDYLLVQFGINDAAYNKEDRYAKVCGKASNPEQGSFEWYIIKYVEGALNKKAIPILITTVIGMKCMTDGKFRACYGNYCDAMKNVSSEYRIPLIDLSTIMVQHYNSIGYDKALKYHMAGAVQGSTDMTHFCETGAKVVAGFVADAIKKLSLPVSANVK